MNKQFKVGDRVRRIDVDREGGAKVGQVAKVVDVTSWGTLIVVYDGHQVTSDRRGEIWVFRYAELVQVQESPCKFVPGNKYKDRTGKEYRFVIYAEEAAPPYRAVFLTSTGNITCRHSDGILNLSGRTSDLDILPNKKTRTICVYKNLSTEEHYTAQTSDVVFNMNVWKKIGEVVEEYEEF